MAGLAGVLFANCVFVSPTMFSLSYSAQIIIWVIVGGLGTLLGPVIGCILLQMLTTWAGTVQGVNANLLLGAILVVAVLLLPKGLLPTAGLLLGRVRRSAMTALLETRALTMRFGGVVAVDRVDFTLREGELRCLIGPNGAGKSTFFKCLTGQLRPTAGRMTFRGARHDGPRPVSRSRGCGIGIKTQVPSVFDGLSVREQVWLAARAAARRA